MPVNKTLIKRVSVINEGRAPIDLRFDLMGNLLRDKGSVEKVSACVPKSHDEIIKYREYVSMRSNEDDKSLHMDTTYASQALTIEPSKLTQIRTNEKIDITIKFKATSRINAFTQKIGAMLFDSTILSLFIIRGNCVGPEFRLDKTYMAFGTVVQGCISETKLVLMNIGDVGGK